MPRLDVLKTYKLFIKGGFPRTESGRSMIVKDAKGQVFAHLCRASRKDLRDAVEAARSAQPGWAGRTAYNRGQILYRMAEMLEGRREEFVEAITQTTGDATRDARAEVDASIDRLVAFAGWCDKFAQVIGCQNPVAGPYYNFTVPEATGVVGIVCANEPSLLGLVSMLAPAICPGNVVVMLASEKYPLPAAIFGEVCATSDLPGGVVNILTGQRSELIEHLADHREIGAIAAAGVSKAHAGRLKLGAAENIKRVHIGKWSYDDYFDATLAESPWTIEHFVEMKTIWHPSAT